MHQLDLAGPDNRTIGTVLRSQAELAGDDIFLVSGERALSFSATDALVNSYAGGLRELGVSPGDRINIFMENSIELVLTALAANRLGATWVPINTSYAGTWLAETIEDTDARLMVVDEDLFHLVRELGGTGSLKRVVRLGLDETAVDSGLECLPFGLLDSGRTTVPDVEMDSSAISAIMWTSGTTGRSKGVAQTHSAWLYGAEAFRRARQTQPGDRLYCCLPMYNSGGWVFNVFHALIDGISVAIDKHFSVREFWDRTRHYGATQITTLGAMHIYLWQAPPRPDDADNPVRVAGFVPIPHELVEPMKERFGIDQIWQGYGQSEVMPASLAYPGRSWKPNSTGVIRPDLELALLDDRDVPVAVGEVGEVSVRPKRAGAIFSGYFNRPDLTVEAFSNLWYHTGDLGRVDADGELFFVDRKKDVMRHKGRNIASIDVEKAAQSHPDVHEVAAHGVPSPELAYEDEVKICVVTVAGSQLTAEALAAHIMRDAPYFIVPRYIEFLDELPHTPTGRVQKFKLRERGVTTQTWDRENSGFVVERQPKPKNRPVVEQEEAP